LVGEGAGPGYCLIVGPNNVVACLDVIRGWSSSDTGGCWLVPRRRLGLLLGICL